jgi:hypothetical protein
MTSTEIIRSIKEAQAIPEDDLWDQFAGSMEPVEMLARYDGPSELGVHGAGWTATREVAACIEVRLWNHALAVA